MKNCPEEAITVDRKTKTWKIDHDRCCQCGICKSKCPKKCLEFVEAEDWEAAEKAKAEALVVKEAEEAKAKAAKLAAAKAAKEAKEAKAAEEAKEAKAAEEAKEG